MLPIGFEIVTSSVPFIVAETLGAGAVIFGLSRYFKHTNVKAQLAAKDAVIETNQQTIEAIEDRLKVVEEQLVDLKADLVAAESKNDSLTTELRDWEQKYKSLETFAAPQLGQQLIDMFNQQENVLNRIVVLLDSIEKRMDAIESKASHN